MLQGIEVERLEDLYHSVRDMAFPVPAPGLATEGLPTVLRDAADATYDDPHFVAEPLANGIRLVWKPDARHFVVYTDANGDGWWSGVAGGDRTSVE